MPKLSSCSLLREIKTITTRRKKDFKKKLTHNPTKLNYILHNTCVMYYFSMIKIEIKYWKAEL